MRVLFWQEQLTPATGGVQRSAASLLRGLRDAGHELTVVTHSSSPEPSTTSVHGIPVRGLPFATALQAGNVGAVMELRREVLRLKRAIAPDVIHVNGFGPSVLYHLETARAHPRPFLLTMHSSNYPPGHAHTLLGAALRAASWVTGCSVAMLGYARGLAPEITPRSSHVYPGMAPSPVAPEPLPGGAARVLCLGWLRDAKGFDLAIAACAGLRHRFPGLRVIVAGDGPARGDLERQAAGLGALDMVDFVGWIAPERVPSLMNTVSLVVVPSRRESFGLVALEAALMARPVVAARIDGLPEVVVHEETGILVEPESPPALAEGIAFLLDRPATARTLGHTARARALDVFSLGRHVDGYGALYRRLAGGVG